MTDDPRILLVDDSALDALMMRKVLDRIGFAEPLQFANGGEDAIARLRGDGQYGDRRRFPLPTLLLLDLNMPRVDGFEVLAWIRRQPTLRRLSVFVLSASSRVEDIERAAELGANSYLVKPGSLDGLTQLALGLAAWLKLSYLAPVGDRIAGHGLGAAT